LLKKRRWFVSLLYFAPYNAVFDVAPVRHVDLHVSHALYTVRRYLFGIFLIIIIIIIEGRQHNGEVIAVVKADKRFCNSWDSCS
jgi:cytochrome oxidase assembly protein ShyY1